jgi:hypothetical protein
VSMLQSLDHASHVLHVSQVVKLDKERKPDIAAPFDSDDFDIVGEASVVCAYIVFGLSGTDADRS